MSTIEMEGNQQQPEEPPNKNARIEECRENAKPNEANLLINDNEAMESALDLPNGRRRPLPLELNCEIFKCLKVPIQRKFIWGMGRDIYAIFRRKLLVKTKRLRNPRKNCWIRTERTEDISADGLTINSPWKCFFARLPFHISGNCRKKDDYPGTILYYFEVAQMSTSKFHTFRVGLSNGKISAYGRWICNSQNYHYYGNGSDHCSVSGNKHILEWPNNAEWNGKDDVVGCGLVLNPNNQLAIFFTGNGTLMGKQIEINKPMSSNYLYPIVIMEAYSNLPLQTNFGDDPDIPFEYNIEKCPGLGLN